MTAGKLSTAVGGMDVAKSRGHGVVIEAVHWEHYAERVESIDLPNLDEGNFLAGCVGALVSTLVALVGVVLGTDAPSAYFIAILVAVLLAAAGGTWYFWRQYDRAKSSMKKTGAQICKEMREVALDQKKRAGLAE
jgi:hypothetical protein